MRLFVRIDIDKSIRERIVEFVQRLERHAPEVRFVGADTYHITLKFLGETNKVSAIEAALANVRGVPFELSFSGTGVFPNAREPRVFWAGVKAGAELKSLAERVSDEMARLGFPREREFNPHLTLARSGSGSPRRKPGERGNLKFHQLQSVLEGMPKPEFGTMTAREVILYESRLGPGGAQYIARGHYELKPRNGSNVD